MILIFDTETTGIPPLNQKGKGYLPAKDFLAWNDCRLVELAWVVCNAMGGIIKQKEYIIKPKYFIIPEESTAIHKITHEEAKLKGAKIEMVLKEFLEDLEQCDLLVGHNLAFDYQVVLAELYRMGIENDKYNTIEKYCTMLHGATPETTWPRLPDLYKRIFQTKPPYPLHRAINDVLICKDIYFYQAI